ncbi:MAG: dockerin type I repeat-containing protein [Fuerstiella sp.]
MKNDKQSKWSGKTLPNGRQPDHQNQSGPPDEQSEMSDEERLPAEVVETLQHSNRHELPVPDSVRAAILSDASEVLRRSRNQVAKSQPLWSRRSWMGISAGVLASALLIVVMLPQGPGLDNGAEPAMQNQPVGELADAGRSSLPSFRSATLPVGDPSGKDVDGNGRVNIVDAFLLAKSIDRKESADQFEIARLDQNGDGVVNSEDVSSIAMSVVML